MMTLAELVDQGRQLMLETGWGGCEVIVLNEGGEPIKVKGALYWDEKFEGFILNCMSL